MNASNWSRALACAMCLSSSVCLSSGARAQAAAEPGAEKLADQRFSEALSMMEAKRYAEACALFEESQHLAPASGTLLNLADCYQQLGRLARASETFAAASESARQSGNVARQQVAQQRGEALAPRLAHVVVSVADAVPGLSVTLDGVELPASFWATPKAVDPGAHVVRATAPGYQPWERSLPALAEGATRTLAIPRLDPVAPAPAAQASPKLTEEPTDWQAVGALTGAAVGAVAVVGGTLFAIESQSKHEDSDRYCDGSDCSDQRGVDAMDDAIVAGNRATACFIVAGVGLGVAGVLWFVRPFDAADPTPTQVGIGPGRVELRVRW